MISDSKAALLCPELLGEAIEYYFYPNSRVPVFCPTDEQFADFEALVTAIEPLSLQAGVCKIIPPKKWRAELEASSSAAGGSERVFSDDKFPILKPIVQHFVGSSGTFHQYNVEFHRRLKLAQFFQMSQDENHRMPETGKSKKEDKDDEDDVCDSDEVGIAVDYVTGGMRLTRAAAEGLKEGVRSENARTRFRPAVAEYQPQADAEGEPAASHNDREPAERRFTRDGRPLFVTAREYTHNEEVERKYWKNLLFNPPLYGADVLGTLFPEEKEFPEWNIRNLPGLLRRVEQRMPGVNDPYLYLGMWKATFAWHVEDMDLYSINYLHFGAPKAWYSIPIDEHSRFEMKMRNEFANNYKECSQFLRHKAFLLSPRLLDGDKLPFNRVVQRAGEIMLTFPHGYHAGFNHGFNCAESVNFALDRWLDIARDSKHCECVGDSVTIDLMEWFGDQVQGKDDGRRDTKVSPRRHAAAAAAIAVNSKATTAKRPPGRPRKTDVSAPSSPAKRKAEPPKPESAKRQRRSAASKPSKKVEDAQEEPPVDPSVRYASLLTPVGTCGACLLPIDGNNQGSRAYLAAATLSCVECVQCGLTVHPQCSALSFDDGNYKCANCLMDTDQLSCSLCAFQNGLLLPVHREGCQGSESEFAHFLCGNFIDEVYFDFPPSSSSSASKAAGSAEKGKKEEDERIGTRSRTAAAASKSEGGCSAKVCGIEKIAKSRFKNKCSVCLGKSSGAVVQCAHPDCHRMFHPMCAATKDPALLNWSLGKILCKVHSK
ncbi:hypothetical protein LPJ53_002073 [Coemansia erecta]|uniref:[histone H3]-trimethyl-L-lysine(9) demethylase n=1 Tax=Coemansia erecta TaxID=147472 RepID=A0A9W7Y3K6_9FUNG|nr:hypothetical protein LPJ53_002073 [Coemansia erecta]